MNILITGIASGIGAHLAAALSAEGHSILGLDRLVPHTIAPDVRFIQVDVSDVVAVGAVFDRVAEEGFVADALINNAAIARFERSILEIDPAEFDRIISVNLGGTFYCAQHFVRLFAANRLPFGRIINIASTRAFQSEPGWEGYAASKGGVVALTHALAASLAAYPITVNSISPGWICCEEYDQLIDTDHQQHLSGRVGRPEDIAQAVRYLLAPTNDFVNGQNLIVDGGMTRKMIYQ